jgi:hypothetical protein
MKDFATSQVADAFAAFPSAARDGLLELRDLIFATADDLAGVPSVTEDLRWGEPAYLTPPGIGSTIRLAVPKSGGFGLFAHCRTTIISDFAQAYPGWDRFDGNRAVLFDDIKQIDPVRHGALITSALTYHLR